MRIMRRNKVWRIMICIISCISLLLTGFAVQAKDINSSGGGVQENVITLPDVEPIANMKFAGYKLNGDESKLYQAGDTVVVNQELANGSTELKFEAVYEVIDVKYAVAIYGINQDVDQNGNQISLTFGPATGADYTSSFKACPGTSEGNPMHNGHKCLHWMTWSEIIDQANKDPNVFMDCLKNGCTHSVELSFGDSPLKGSKTYPDMSGDGASILSLSLNLNYRKWNNERSNTGGWPASRIRTTLNGSDKCKETQSSVAGRTDLLMESQALISAFPEELRNAIVPKAVKSDTVHYNEDAKNIKTVYDKLWLFSGAEVYKAGSSRIEVIRNNEGLSGSTKYYLRTGDMNITTNSYSGNICYNESGFADLWWLRSQDIRSGYVENVYTVRSSGEWDCSVADNAGNIAPGFCIGKVQ